MWTKKEIDLGRVKAGKAIDIHFDFTGKDKFQSAIASCGCSVPVWNEEKRRLEVTYTPSALSPYLKQQGKTEYNSEKTITVTMINEAIVSSYQLKFKATVYE